jgi:hypothetical protein
MDPLESNLNRWRQRCHKSDGTFYADGIVGDPTRWYRSPLRVAFIGKEPNDRPGLAKSCGADLRRLFLNPSQSPKNRKRFETNLGRWAYGIHGTSSQHIPSFDDSTRGAASAIRDCAVINLKKTGGGGTANLGNVRCHLRLHSQLFLEQLELIDPTVVVCCGCTELVLPLLEQLHRLESRAIRHRGRLWIESYYPSARLDDITMYNRLLADYCAAAFR